MTYLIIVEKVVDPYTDEATLVHILAAVKVDVWRTVDLIDAVGCEVRSHVVSVTDFVAVDLMLADDLATASDSEGGIQNQFSTTEAAAEEDGEQE